MLLNYIKIALRNLNKNKSYAFINIFGLAVGMACCILIAMYSRSELSFDTFHKKSDRIVVVGSDGSFFGKMLNTPYPLADALKDEVPSVEKAVRVSSTGKINLSVDGQDFVEIAHGTYTEDSFLNIFSFDLIRGDSSQALSAPNSIVLTQEASRQLFGDQNPIGRSLYWQQRDTTEMLQVTGIAQDPPRNSTIKFGALISFNTMDKGRRDPSGWNMYSYSTFALLKSGNAITSMPDQLDKLAKAHYKSHDKKHEAPSNSFFAMPLSQLHLSEVSNDEGFTGNRAYLYLFGSVALFILIIACVNYVNLATARISLRSQEVGVRKSLGALRSQVAGQFLGESIFLSVTSFLLGVVTSIIVLPYFNQLFGTSLQWQGQWTFILELFFSAIGVGILAGLYPALYLSGFSPVTVLRNRMNISGSGSWLRKSLVVTQFAIALVLIISALIVYDQLNYTQTTDLGFDGKQVAAINLPNNQTWEMRKDIRNRLLSHSGIEAVSVTSGVPGEFHIRLSQKPENISPQEKAPSDKSITFAPAVIDYSYLKLLHIKLLAGRNFSRDLNTDKKTYIINKLGAKRLGWTPKEAIGKTFTLGKEGKIIGVTENFHIQSFRSKMEPVVLQLQESSSWHSGGSILARITPGNIPATMNYIKKMLAKYAPHSTFNYQFLDAKFDAMYRTERRLANIVAIFTFIAIMIACLGLYGLSAFSAERRTKEIGIRKVLGATITNIVGLLSKDFLKLVLLGFVLAIPVAWYAMHKWLQDFAYHIKIGAGVFVIAGIGAILIAIITISWQSVRAALANPVESLQSE